MTKGMTDRLERELAKRDIEFRKKRLVEIERQIRKLEREQRSLISEIDNLKAVTSKPA